MMNLNIKNTIGRFNIAVDKLDKKNLNKLVNGLVEDPTKRLISVPLERQLRKIATGQKIKQKYNLNDLIETLQSVKNNNGKVRTFKQLNKYAPTVIYMQIQLFKECSKEAIRFSTTPHRDPRRKKNMIAPDDYIVIGKDSYWVGETSNGYSEHWRNVLIHKSKFDALKRENIIVHKGYMKTHATYFTSNDKFIESIENDEVKSDIERARVSFDITIVLRSFEVIKQFDGVIREPEKIDVMKAVQEKRTNNKYLSYNINPLAKSLDELFIPDKYFKSNCCLPNAIMSTWADKYNKLYATQIKKGKREMLSYALILKLVKPDETYVEGMEIPMSFDDAKIVFKYLRQEAFLHLENGKLVAEYHPEQDRLKIDSYLFVPMRLILQAEHVYLINDPDMKRSIALTEFKEEEIKQPSANYNQINIQKKALGVVNSINEVIYKVMPTVQQTIDDKETTFVEVVLNSTTENLKDLLDQLLNMNYVPIAQIDYYNKVKRLSMKINNVVVSIIPINYGNDAIQTQDIVDITDEQALEYQELSGVLQNRLTQLKHRSSYSENFLNIDRYFSRSPETIVFNNAHRSGVVGIDNSKCYPSIIAKDLKLIPVFSKFDMFQEYTNDHITNEYNYYIVKKLDTFPTDLKYKVLINKDMDKVPGYMLEQFKDHVQIVAFIVPHKLVENDLAHEIKKVFDSGLSEKQKKDLLVSAIGKHGTVKRKATRSKIYLTEEDAHRNKTEGDDILPMDLIDKRIYVKHGTKRTDLVNGFIPIQTAVYDMCRWKVFNLIESLPAEVEVLGVKCDCVFIKEEHLKYVSHIPLKENFNGNIYSNIGKWKVDVNAKLPDLVKEKSIINKGHVSLYKDWVYGDYTNEDIIDLLRKRNGIKIIGRNTIDNKVSVYELSSRVPENVVILAIKRMVQQEPEENITTEFNYNWIYKKQIPNIHLLKDEYSTTEVLDILKKTKLLMIQGVVAGSGKSTLCEQLILHFRKTNTKFIHAVACPQNSQALDWKIKKDGAGNSLEFNAMTLYQLFNKRLDDDGNVENGRNYKNDYDMIVPEEGGLFTTYEWSMIQDYETTHPDTYIIVNMDTRQNEPIDTLNENINASDYYNDIINYMFQEQIYLQIPKRFQDDDGKMCPIRSQQVIKMTDDLFKNGASPRAVLYENAKKIKLNDIPSNAMVISFTNETKNNMNSFMHDKNNKGKGKYFNGLRLKSNRRMIYIHDKIRVSIQKNYEYTIINLGDKETIIQDVLDKTEITICNKKLNNFSYCHAYTGHSVQGQSTDRPVVIFDYKHPYITANWMYPALTRNRKLDIYYCDEKVESSGLSRDDIKNKISGYKEQDKNNNFEISEDFIDVPHIFKLSKQQKHICLMCKNVMNRQNEANDLMNWTVDRIDSTQPHTKTNTQLLCVSCNSSKKQKIINM